MNGLTANNFKQGKQVEFEPKCGHKTCVSFKAGLLVVHCDKSALMANGDCLAYMSFRMSRLCTLDFHQHTVKLNMEQLRIGCSACNNGALEPNYIVVARQANGKLHISCPVCMLHIYTGNLAKSEEIH